MASVEGHITNTSADITASAANSSLRVGGAVYGPIRRAAWIFDFRTNVQKSRPRQGKCLTGEAVVTTAGNLPAMYFIHTV
nr:macro domain-containing protein [Flavobacterium sp. B17]